MRDSSDVERWCHGLTKKAIIKDLNLFVLCYRRTIQAKSSEAEVGDICGEISQNEGRWTFSLRIKKHPRAWQSLNDEVMRGDIDEKGEISYSFKRTWESRILTVAAPCLVAFIVFLGLFIPVFRTAIPGLIPATILFVFNFIKPKKRRQALKDCFMRLVDCSNNEQ